MFDRIAEGRYWDKPWSLISGCTPCSPGCAHCWALAMEQRFRRSPAYSEFNVEFEVKDYLIKIHPERLDIPLRRKKPTVWAVWNDLFHEDVPRSFQSNVMLMIKRSPQHTFLLLTKRINRMNEFFDGSRDPLIGTHVPQNCWPGVTVCNQDELWKISELRKIEAAVRWVSFEPLLGPVNVKSYLISEWRSDSPISVDPSPPRTVRQIDWVVLGGETGPGARPLDPAWAESVLEQCRNAKVPFFFKSWGDWQHRVNKVGKANMRFLYGREWNKLPGPK